MNSDWSIGRVNKFDDLVGAVQVCPVTVAGILVEGVGCVLAGMWGSGNAASTYSENVGVIGATKVNRLTATVYFYRRWQRDIDMAFPSVGLSVRPLLLLCRKYYISWKFFLPSGSFTTRKWNKIIRINYKQRTRGSPLLGDG